MRKFFSRLASSESVAGYVFLLPNFLGFLLFTFLPVLASLCLSFTDWDLMTPAKFVGLANFNELFHDRSFWQYVGNTLFLMMAIPVNMAGAMALALLMNQKIRGIVAYRAIFFLPSVCSAVAVCLLWKWLYNPDFGLINALLLNLGIQGPAWLSDPVWAKPALMIMGFWGAIGGMNMILYLAALQGVPRELYEAASIDGAGAWRKFKDITFPYLTPTTFFIGTMGIIGGFQGGFMGAFMMTGGGPAGATTTIEYYIYNNAYSFFKMGYAASIAWVLFIAVFLVTLFNWRFGGKLVHYN